MLLDAKSESFRNTFWRAKKNVRKTGAGRGMERQETQTNGAGDTETKIKGREVAKKIARSCQT